MGTIRPRRQMTDHVNLFATFVKSLLVGNRDPTSQGGARYLNNFANYKKKEIS